MPRSREFCPSEALEKAMRVFWAKGFSATSIDDLVGATGVSRYGLYGEFGDKNGLFLAALNHYRVAVVQPLLDILSPPAASLDAVRTLFRTLGTFAREGERLGCLVFNAVNEQGQHDEVTAARIDEIRGQVVDGVSQALTRAVENGELPATFDIRREVDFLSGILHALPVMARSGAAPEVIDNVVAVTLSTLERP